MSIYIGGIMTILILFGEFMWDNTKYEAAEGLFLNGPTGRAYHFTWIFNTFVFMTLFNEINCRMIGAKAFNVFANILSNWMFLAVIAGVVCF